MARSARRRSAPRRSTSPCTSMTSTRTTSARSPRVPRSSAVCTITCASIASTRRSTRRATAGVFSSGSGEISRASGGTDMKATKGIVVSAGGGTHLDMGAPGRFAALKLLGHETNESVMLFEETVPAGTKSLFHLHQDSDEVAWVLAGEITFQIGDEVSVGGPGTCAFFPRNVPHAWKNSGSETGRVVFLYTPA